MTVAEALLAISRSDVPAALEALNEAATDQAGGSVAPALRSFLLSSNESGVYDEPSAFESFINNGDNPRLYANTIDRVAGTHRRSQPEAVLDLGCGDGRVTAATLQASTTSIELVEPSAELLQIATGRLGTEAQPRQLTVHQTDAQRFLAGAGADRNWDLVQSTFAMHTLPHDERAVVLAAFAARTTQLVMVEFDVPSFTDRSIEHAEYAAERYEHGLDEYFHHPEVIRGFLMPVLVGQFDPSQPRHTFEQSNHEWMSDLKAAGFSEVRSELVANYWWGPAMLIHATN